MSCHPGCHLQKISNRKAIKASGMEHRLGACQVARQPQTLTSGLVLQGFDVKRLYYGRHNKPDMDQEGVELLTDLDEFLKLPLSDKTK